MTQLRFADERWFGGSSETNDTSGTGVVRHVHPELARFYSVYSDATGPRDRYRMPKDVRTEQVGLFVVIANHGGQLVRIEDKDGSLLHSLTPNRVALVILDDVSTAAGSWTVFSEVDNGKAPLS